MKFLYAMPIIGIILSCSNVATTTATANTSPSMASAKDLPMQLAYKMKGDYANLVPVTMDSNHEEIISYPDPCDINSNQRPVALGDGWYLDRRGISMNTAFLDYTYEAYAALKKAPTIEELKAHIIDKEGIKDIVSLGKKQLSIDEAKQLVKEGFPGCKRIIAEIIM